MSTIQLQLPQSIRDFLEADANAKGYSSPSEYVAALLSALQQRQTWHDLEPLVLAGLATPARPMTRADWQELHAEIDQIEAQQKQS
jgi:Arc/MetJ-type ribon-helix-helix transcriptional regulator